MSKLFSLNSFDFVKGVLLAALADVIKVVIETAYNLLTSKGFDWTVLDIKSLGLIAAITFLAYLLKNLFTNSNGQLLKGEPYRIGR